MEGGTQVCLYFEDAKHGHIIPGLDLNILMLGKEERNWQRRCYFPTKKDSFFLSCKNSLINQLVAFFGTMVHL